MVSGHQGSLPSGRQPVEQAAEGDAGEDQEHANNPYDLKAMPGSTVTASYPFRGDDNVQQLSFGVSERDITAAVCNEGDERE